MTKYLIIQTAFIGDVVLATPVIENLKKGVPDAKIDFLLRKGNEGLLEGHPAINKLLIWNKKEGKYKNLWRLLQQIRKEQYDYVVLLQRFASTGFLAAFSKAKTIIGFKKNPFSFAFNKRIEHRFNEGIHEVDRNLDLIRTLTPVVQRAPKLYPSKEDYQSVKNLVEKKYVCLAPASVWFTKQLEHKQWVKLSCGLKDKYHICFLGGPADATICENIAKEADLINYSNFCGKLSFLQSAAMIDKAVMNYVNDSAPMHLASSVNAKVTAFFCSTVPAFGFGPLSEESIIAEVEESLDCRPCGLHGKKECPKRHFNCSGKIDVLKYLPA